MKEFVQDIEGIAIKNTDTRDEAEAHTEHFDGKTTESGVAVLSGKSQ